MVPAPDDPEDFTTDDAPSKSARKRAALAAQDLGEELIGLRDAELDALNLPERLTDAIREARRVTSRGGGARQRQFIGKLMRDVDIEPIRAALDGRNEKTALAAQRFKRLEVWRERLIEEGLPALDDLARGRADFNRPEWERCVLAASAERKRTESTGPAARELFRALRLLFGDSDA